MSWIAGIDYSTKAIDVVLIDEDDERPPSWTRLLLEGQDAFDRTRSVAGHRREIRHLYDKGVVAVGLESPAGNHGVQHMARIQGAILACFHPSVLVQPLPPSQWRKWVGLPGNASKADVMFAVTGWTDHDAIEWPQDACDAYCIARATRTLIQRGVTA